MGEVRGRKTKKALKIPTALRPRTRIMMGAAGLLLVVAFIAFVSAPSPKCCISPGDIKIGFWPGCLIVSNTTSKKLVGNFRILNVTNLPTALDEGMNVVFLPHNVSYVSLGPLADYARGPYRVRLVVSEELKGSERVIAGARLYCSQLFRKARSYTVPTPSNPFQTNRTYLGHSAEAFNEIVKEGIGLPDRVQRF